MVRTARSWSSPTASSRMDGDIAPAARHLRCRRALRSGGHGRRRPRLGRAGPQRPRHDRSLRPARPRRHPGRHAVQGGRRPGRLRRRATAPARLPDPALAAASCSRPRSRRPLPQPASPRSTCSSRNPSGSSGCGTTPASSSAACRSSASTPASPRRRSRRSSWAIGRRGAADDAARLFELGIFATAVVYPTVALDKARIRTIVSSEHARDDLQACLDAFATVGRELRLI